MARLQRIYSNTGYYHIMLRGNERKKVFSDNEDRLKFMEIILKKKAATNMMLIAYCLMDNHVHLVVRDDNNEISLIMKGIATSYAMFFNNKYGRVGHLFQDRYKSEAIEDERYLMAAIRYVHNNPVKSGIVNNPEQYQWSSYKFYITTDPAGTIVDANYILGMISENKNAAIAEFKRFSTEINDSQCMDLEEMRICTLADGDAYLRKYINKNWPGVDKAELRKNKAIVNELIEELRTNTNLSIVKIASLLGINRGMVERKRP